jgi:hypothetical protein
MDIEQSSLYREIQAIIASGANPVHFNWSATFHANGQDLVVMKVLDVDYERDYENNYSDSIRMHCQILAGTFWMDIYPYSDNLEVTLYKYPLNEVGSSPNLSQPTQTERYTAILRTQGSPTLENTGGNNDDRTTMNLKDFQFVEVELVDRALYQLRMRGTGGNFRNCTTGDALMACLTTESQRVQVDNARVIQGVNMVTPNNTTLRDHVAIPQGMPVVHVPQWIHQKCGGVYSAGMGYYLQANYWWVYPCYDPTRGNKAAPALTIINMPKNKFRGIERTYRQSGSNVVILATGDVKFRDYSNMAQLNRGNGVRFADAAKLIDGFVTTKGGIPTAARGKINTEAITVARPDGLNNAQSSHRNINANPFLEYSDMAKRNGSVIALTWENSDPSLITPGMLVSVMYLDGENVVQLYGVMLKAHHHVRLDGSGMTTMRYATDSALSIFVQRPIGNGFDPTPAVVSAS